MPEILARRPTDIREFVTGDVAVTAITPAELLAAVRRLPEGCHKSTLTMSIEAALRPYKEFADTRVELVNPWTAW